MLATVINPLQFPFNECITGNSPHASPSLARLNKKSNKFANKLNTLESIECLCWERNSCSPQCSYADEEINFHGFNSRVGFLAPELLFMFSLSLSWEVFIIHIYFFFFMLGRYCVGDTLQSLLVWRMACIRFETAFNPISRSPLSSDLLVPQKYNSRGLRLVHLFHE